MNAERMVGQDEPLMIAWNAYKATEEYANSRQWAEYKAHLDGSLWAAFCAGYAARDDELRKQEPSPTAWMTAVKDRIRWLSRSLEKALTAPIPPTVTPSNKDWYAVAVGVEKTEGIISLGAEKEVARLTEALAETHDAWSGTMEVCRVRGTHGRADYITTGNRMDNRCNLRVTFNGSELIKAEIARPPNTPDGLCMFAVIGMPTPPEGSGK